MNREPHQKVYDPASLLVDSYLKRKSPFDSVIRSIPARYMASFPLKYKTISTGCSWFCDGRKVVTSGVNGEVYMWSGSMYNFEASRKLYSSENPNNFPVSLTTLSVSDMNSLILVGQENGFIKYCSPTLDILASFKGHNEAVREIATSHNETKFVSCSDDASIKIFDLLQGKCETTFNSKLGSLGTTKNKTNNEININKNDTNKGDNKTTKSEEKSENQLPKTQTQGEIAHRWNVTSVNWHSSLSMISSGSMDRTVRLWDPREKKLLFSLLNHKNRVSSVSLDSEFSLLSGSMDCSACLVDLRNPFQVVQTYRDNSKEVSCLKFHPFKKGFFVLGCTDGSICFYETSSKQAVGKIQFGHDYSVNDFSWHPFGDVLISCSKDHSTKLWGDETKGKFSERFNFIEMEVDEQLRMVKRFEEEFGMEAIFVRKMKKWMIEEKTGVKRELFGEIDELFEDIFGCNLFDSKIKRVYDSL